MTSNDSLLVVLYEFLWGERGGGGGGEGVTGMKHENNKHDTNTVCP